MKRSKVQWRRSRQQHDWATTKLRIWRYSYFVQIVIVSSRCRTRSMACTCIEGAPTVYCLLGVLTRYDMHLDNSLCGIHGANGAISLQQKVEIRINAWMALSRAEEVERKCLAR